MTDPYQTLEIRPDASDPEIVAAYRVLARRFHPDYAGPAATTAMARINAAFETLRTPERRRTFDRLQQVAGLGGSAPSIEAVRIAAWYWTHPAPDGTGAAGPPPPGRPSGSILAFGRHIGWSLGEVARSDVGYLEWLLDRSEAQALRSEITGLLVRLGRRDADDARPAAAGPAWRARR